MGMQDVYGAVITLKRLLYNKQVIQVIFCIKNGVLGRHQTRMIGNIPDNTNL
jgi:hypothetical protein